MRDLQGIHVLSHFNAASCFTESDMTIYSLCWLYIRQRRPSLSSKIGKGCPYSIIERRVPELIPVLGSQPAGDVSHKPGGRLPLFSARPAVTLATLKRAATNFAAW